MKIRLKSFFFSFCILFLGSCATILNNQYQDVRLVTASPAKIVLNKDTLETHKNSIKIKLERNEKIKEVHVLSDSSTKIIKIKPIKSIAYWANIPYTYGIGLFFDKSSNKRFGYPLNIYVDATDTLTNSTTYNSFKNDYRKGTTKLHISLPWVNSFYLQPNNESFKSNTGFIGLSLGVDYYHKSYQYLSLTTRLTTDFIVPFPAPVHFSGEHEFMNSFSINLTNNHSINRFSFGYGLSVAKNTWNLNYYNREDTSPPAREPAKKSHYTFGFTFPSYIQLARSFNVGLVYSPYFYRPALSEKFRYEHLISLDLAWKIKL
ncbi:hypothetical protein D3C87_314640 [compost metagenome]